MEPIAKLTLDEIVKIRACLYKAENSITRLINQNDFFVAMHRKEVEEIKDVKAVLDAAINRG